ncbi:sigma-70 family RNA polymerase sigma factor [Aureliella helgolandensis]|uniref:ECF RNA polymerase sigma factor SigE n=1 Tax=Aureliella helgolandensis TaxID=2527968 RepID=A0A518GD63_9BACT|nr:sigma-70 family RNA polymerase sigma factor [Aureliella helgolandensis]QDV26508.1 ECF RNA polymerase sigma factor SigE [Aureliella helgolandensis]
MLGPETRASLIASLNDPASEEAWTEFAAVYRPLVIRVARAKGLQNADADDVAQDVLSAVGKSLESFTSSGEGSFRRWLYQITRNLVVNQLMRGPFSGRRGPIGSGDSDVQYLLSQAPTPEDQTATLFRIEYRRARFQQAAEKVKNQFSELTWQCFWQTSVENQSVEHVASSIGKTVGAVRVARCRVLAKIREEIQNDIDE